MRGAVQVAGLALGGGTSAASQLTEEEEERENYMHKSAAKNGKASMILV